MTRNMSGLDRIIRLLIVAVVAVLFYMNLIEGAWGFVLLTLASVFLLTGFINFCPLYTLLGLHTNKEKPY